MKISTALVFLFLVSCMATAQDRPAVTAQPNTVFVSADGKFEANPDTAVMQFNISVQDDTSRAAYDRASKSAEQVRQILRSNGIDPKDAQFSRFSTSASFAKSSFRNGITAVSCKSGCGSFSISPSLEIGQRGAVSVPSNSR